MNRSLVSRLSRLNFSLSTRRLINTPPSPPPPPSSPSPSEIEAEGLGCLKIGLDIENQGNNSNQALDLGEKACRLLFKVSRWSISMSKSYYLVASAYFNLGQFDKSLQNLEKAHTHLGKIEKKGADPSDIRLVLTDVIHLLAKTHDAMGAKPEALVYHKKLFEMKEFSPLELGVANIEMAEKCVYVLEFQDALRYGQIALQIRQPIYGDKSVEAAHDRCLLADIYHGLGMHGKALEEIQQSQEIYSMLGLLTESIRAEINKSKIYNSLKKFDKAIDILEMVLQKVDNDSELSALVFLVMGNSFCELKKFSNAKNCLEISCEIFDRLESDIPVEVAKSYIETSILYETLAEFEKSVSFLKRALDILQNFPQEQYLKGTASARLGGLLLNTGKVDESIPYLENGAILMVKSLGSNHPRVGICFTHLGAAYTKIHRPQCAKQMFQIAKDIKIECKSTTFFTKLCHDMKEYKLG